MPAKARSVAGSKVVVVGAGPVGLMAALRLRQQGVAVRVIDQQPEKHAHTFPVVLHPQTTRLLAQLSVSAPLFWRGRPITRLAIYPESEPRSVLSLRAISSSGEGLLTLPRDVLRQALTNELQRLGVEVEWNVRLLWLEQDDRYVWGRLAVPTPLRLDGPARVESVPFEADYVVGADGYDSTVREAVGLRLVDHGPTQTFAFFDTTTQRSGNEAQLVFRDELANSVYPLQGDRSRFTFQLVRSLDRAPDAAAFHELLRSRMPWHSEEVLSVDWGGVAEFRRALVEHYGTGRVWLAGEAAHLTGPLGVQSLNIGMDEANELAQRIVNALAHPEQPAFGAHYDGHRRRQWEKLLGLAPLAGNDRWSELLQRDLVAALPASGDDLEGLLTQLSPPSGSSAEPSVAVH